MSRSYGYWLSASSGKYFPVTDHAEFALDNIGKMKLDEGAVNKIKNLHPIADRKRTLLAVFKDKGKWIRLRSHDNGSLLSIEGCLSLKTMKKSVNQFLKKEFVAGPSTLLHFNHLRKRKQLHGLGGFESVLGASLT